MKPLLSVVVPVFNHAGVLESCLRSISNQTYRPLEVLVVNDGSTDHFNSVIEKLRGSSWFEELGVRVFTEANKGAAAARNLGLQKSQGEYVIFWDADTEATPQMLEKMQAALDIHPEASYSYCSFRFGWKKMTSRKFEADALRAVNYIDTTSLIRRKDVVPFDENLKRFQDWDLWLTMLEQGKQGIFISEVLFRKKIARKGISSWLPKFVYNLPWKSAGVKRYEAARQVIFDKHRLPRAETSEK